MPQCEFVIWESAVLPNVCSLYQLEGVLKQYQLRDGVSRSTGFSEDAAFKMHPDFPNDIMLADNLINSNMMIVASEKVHDFLKHQNLQTLEYLPVKIIDHIGRATSRKYYIIHPIEPLDCINFSTSNVEWSDEDHKEIDRMHKLEIDSTKVPSDIGIFKLKQFCDLVLVRRTLANLMDQQGFTGNRWDEIEAYKY